MKKKYYVYIYLDPRKPGEYRYKIGEQILELDYQPIYVGKGCNGRYLCHWLNFDIHPNNFLKGKLSHIDKENLIPTIFLRDSLTEKRALEFEINLIKTIGRINLGKGPLCNLTDGGEGVSGVIYSEERKKNYGKKMKRCWRDPEYRRKQVERMMGNQYSKGMVLSEESKGKIRKSMSELWKEDQEYQKKMKKRSEDPKVKNKIKNSVKKLWENPEYRRKRKETDLRPETKKRRSEAARKRWAKCREENGLN